MYNGQRSDDRDGTPVMSGDPGSDPRLSVFDLYAHLAAGRAVDAGTALRRVPTACELMAQGAQSLEDAAGTLQMLSEMYAESKEAFSASAPRGGEHIGALAAQFEQPRTWRKRSGAAVMGHRQPSIRRQR